MLLAIMEFRQAQILQWYEKFSSPYQNENNPSETFGGGELLAVFQYNMLVWWVVTCMLEWLCIPD